MATTIKQLTAADLLLARALNAMFGAAFGERDTYEGRPPRDSYLTRILAKPHVLVLVALEGASVVGGLVAYELEKLEQARSEVYIYDLAVAETHRRQGIATALIGALGKHRQGARRLGDVRPGRPNGSARHPPLRVARDPRGRPPLRHPRRVAIGRPQ